MGTARVSELNVKWGDEKELMSVWTMHQCALSRLPACAS